MKAAVYCLDRMGARAVGMKALESFMEEHGRALSLVLMRGVLQFQENALEKAAETFRKAVSLVPHGLEGQPEPRDGLPQHGQRRLCRNFLEKAARIRGCCGGRQRGRGRWIPSRRAEVFSLRGTRNPTILWGKNEEDTDEGESAGVVQSVCGESAAQRGGIHRFLLPRRELAHTRATRWSPTAA